MSREDSYQAVQRNAMKVWLEGKDFLTELKADAEVSKRIPVAVLENVSTWLPFQACRCRLPSCVFG